MDPIMNLTLSNMITVEKGDKIFSLNHPPDPV